MGGLKISTIVTHKPLPHNVKSLPCSIFKTFHEHSCWKSAQQYLLKAFLFADPGR
jgi:hypothetical protein